MVDKTEIRILYNRILRSISDLGLIGEYLSTTSKTFVCNLNYVDRCIQSIEEAIEIINKYNGLDPDFKSVAFKIPEIREDTRVGQTIADLKRLENSLSIIKDYLDIHLSPNLNENERREIEGLTKELEKLEDSLDKKIYKNIKDALNELENNHYLASCLIAGRVINYIIEYLRGEEKIPQEDKINKLVEKLREIGFLGNIENVKETPKFLLDASKSARDLTSHNLETYPNPSDAFGLVANSFRMCHLLIKYQKYKTDQKEINNKIPLK